MYSVTNNLFIGGAARYEDYSDFGSNTTYKINATIWDEQEEGVNSTYKYKIYNGSGDVVGWTQFDYSGSGNYWTKSFDTTNYADGDYTLAVNASDTSGNYNDLEKTNFTIDNNPPKVIIQTPQNNSNLTGFHYFNVTIIDDGYNGNVSTYKYRFDVGTWSSFGGNDGNVWYKK